MAGWIKKFLSMFQLKGYSTEGQGTVGILRQEQLISGKNEQRLVHKMQKEDVKGMFSKRRRLVMEVGISIFVQLFQSGRAS